MKKALITVATVILSMNTMASGEAMFNSLGCIGCHGPAGKSTQPTYPSLAGKDAAYIVEQLKAFQSGARKDPTGTMNAMAPLAAGHEQAIADYLSKQ